MGPDEKKMMSIRLRVESDILDRIDRLVGKRNRQDFIREAILSRLDEDLPPLLLETMNELEELKGRVERLEDAQSASLFLEQLPDVVRDQICLDDMDREMLAYFTRNEGATTPELAGALVGDDTKRRAILNRIKRINGRAKEVLGREILRYRKEIWRGKRSAWWLDLS
ncbi:hypothetical protein EU546_01395 [Candidatus Thorarchaeota archaeon]|nr:MAG: hypothetical protein EU546_01395 [Candidatus Thorarchaeota archaeon]